MSITAAEERAGSVLRHSGAIGLNITEERAVKCHPGHPGRTSLVADDLQDK